MKRALLLFILLSPLLMGTMCIKIPEVIPPTGWAVWYVKNSTDRVLIAPPPLLRSDTLSMINHVAPGDSLRIPAIPISDETQPPFDWLRSAWYYLDDNEVFVEIFSNDNVRLARWNYSDRDLPGRQFFNESFWRYYEELSSDRITEEYIWTFEILPEDLIQHDVERQ